MAQYGRLLPSGPVLYLTINALLANVNTSYLVLVTLSNKKPTCVFFIFNPISITHWAFKFSSRSSLRLSQFYFLFKFIHARHTDVNRTPDKPTGESQWVYFHLFICNSKWKTVGDGTSIRSIMRAAAVSGMTLYMSTIHVMFAGPQIEPVLVVSIRLQTSVLWAQQDETIHRGRLSLPAVRSYPKRGPGQRGIGAAKVFILCG